MIFEGVELLFGLIFVLVVLGVVVVVKFIGMFVIVFFIDMFVVSCGVYLLSFLFESDIKCIVGYVSS